MTSEAGRLDTSFIEASVNVEAVGALWTPFRFYVLRLLYGAVLTDLGERLRTAEVSTWSTPGETDSEILLLSIIADADSRRLDQLMDLTLAAIAKQAAGWTEEERQDYSKRVYFEMEPSGTSSLGSCVGDN